MGRPVVGNARVVRHPDWSSLEGRPMGTTNVRRLEATGSNYRWTVIDQGVLSALIIRTHAPTADRSGNPQWPHGLGDTMAETISAATASRHRHKNGAGTGQVNCRW